MLLSDLPSTSTTAGSSSSSPLTNGYSKSHPTTPSRELAVAFAAATGRSDSSRSDSSARINRHPPSSSTWTSSTPIHPNVTSTSTSYTSHTGDPAVIGNNSVSRNGIHIRPPQQSHSNGIGRGIGVPPSPVISLSESESSVHKTPMEMLAESMKGRMLFAIPKKGRLYTKSLEMLEGADIKFTRSHRLDVCLVQNHPIALLFLPASDISRFVAHGNVDMGITGQDTILESRTSSGVTELLLLGFGSCKLQVQVPEKGPYQTLDSLAGKRIVSSYTTLARDHFRKLDERLGITGGGGGGGGGEDGEEGCTKVEYVGGSVEAACALGLADGIVDLVESGETMRAAGLRAIDTVMTTEAVLIKSSTPKHPMLTPLINKIASRIAGFVASNKYVICQYNVPRELLPIVTRITPGRRAPTISSIEDDGWVAVSAMVEKKEIANVMDQLVEAGAEDTFVVALQNCRVETRLGLADSPVLEKAPGGGV